MKGIILVVVVAAALIGMKAADVRVLPIHDAHYTGVIAGTPSHALVCGHGVISGFRCDFSGALQ